MSFDRIAPYYRLLETLAFGYSLQGARVCWIKKISLPKRVLIVGEGDGRFLSELLRIFPQIYIDCIDSSAKMLELARVRVLATDPESSIHVRFLHRDILTWSPQHSYDLLITHFVLDCFSRRELNRIVQKLSDAATSDAVWLIADFTLPQNGFARIRAKLWLRVMHTFFHITAGITAKELVDATPYLRANGFTCTSRRLM